MKKLSKNKKIEMSGGGVMAAWVAIMGITMLASTIGSTITDIVSAKNGQSDSYSTSSKKQTYMRLSPFPARSVIGMWM